MIKGLIQIQRMEKLDKECYSKMVNQEITNRKVNEEAQKLESNYGIENMII